MKRCKFTFAISLALLAMMYTSQWLGCQRRPKSKAEEGQTNPEQRQDEQVLRVVDSNVPFPCWDQSWDCGDWHPLSYQPEWDSYNIHPVADKTMAGSCCIDCSSLRIINLENRMERIVSSYKGMIKNCKHNWRPCAHAWSLNPIEEGDFFVVVYKRQMHVVSIEKISFYPQDTVSYRIAKAGPDKQLPIEIDLDKLEWDKCFAKEDKIPLGDREIPFNVHEFQPDGKAKPRKVFSIWYDYYYGGPTPDSPPRTPAHIAIIHKKDLGGNSVIDLRKFRFKTWDDGLGNRCDKDLSSRPGN